MKIRTCFLAIIILILFLPVTSVMAKQPGYFKITSMTMDFQGMNATFTMEYELNQIARVYVLLMGAKFIEPKVMEIFTGFDDIEMKKLDEYHAVLVAKNVTWASSDDRYYLHNPHKFGTKINELKIFTPDSIRPKIIYDVNSTPYMYYRK